MGRLPAAMPKTISATDNLLHSAFPPDVRRQVILTTKLAGRTWLEANADRTAAFTALQATVQPPPLPELDQILARVLLDRFGLPRSLAAA